MSIKLFNSKRKFFVSIVLALGLFIFIILQFSILPPGWGSSIATAAKDTGLASKRTNNFGVSSSENNTNLCKQSGYYHELFNYSGKSAECLCATFKEDGTCVTNLTENEKKICRTKNPFWAPGSFKTSGNIAQDGGIIALKGADSSGFHWLMTSLSDSLSTTIGFLKKSPDIFFGRDLFVNRNLFMQDKIDNIFFGGTKNSSSITHNGDEGLNFNLFSSQEVNVLKLLKTDNNNNRIQTNTELIVNDHLKVESADFQGSHLSYCSPADGKCPSTNVNRAHSDNFIYR